MDGMLSQEEINALLSSMSEENVNLDENNDSLTAEEEDAIGEISNISMGTAATTLSTLINRRVDITTPAVSYTTWDEITDTYAKPCVFVQISYKEGLDGNNILILEEDDVKIITDLMMGGDGLEVSGELSELHLSAISEAMNQMMGSSATSISAMLNKKVDISPPNANLINLSDDISLDGLPEFLKDRFVMVSFRMEIEGLIDSQLMQLYPLEFARVLYGSFAEDIKNGSNSQPEPQPEPQPQPVQQTVGTEQSQQMNTGMPAMDMSGQIPLGQMMNGIPPQGMAPQGVPVMPMNMAQYQQPIQQQYMQQPMQDINVAPAQFTPFTSMGNPSQKHENIELIMDVPLEVTVELGRTNKSIKEILDFKPGTIIELNKLAGEPIDVMVNGKYVAKGEVVVIEEYFGIRVTEIVN